MAKPLQTVIETPAYLRSAAEAGMTAEEREHAVDVIAADPSAGAVIAGSGGVRKVRIAGKGKGKSGGYRLITYFSDETVPVFLLTVFAKGDRANLSKAEVNALKELTARLVVSLTGK